MLLWPDPHPPDLETISGSNPQDGSRMKRKTASGKSDSSPCRIGKILGSAMLLQPDNLSKTPAGENCTKQKDFVYQKADSDRILKLEQKFEYLVGRINKLAQMINVGLPSK